MLGVPQLRCENCRTSFPWKKHKRYCSDKCADDAAAARVSEKSQTMMKLPVARLTRQMFDKIMQSRSFPPPDEVHMLIDAHAPAGAIGYRLGCTQPVGGGKYPRIRWFPSQMHRRPALFSLMPFEDPEVPFPYYYVVAYFDANHVLIREPWMCVGIETATSSRPWSAGDRNLKIDSSVAPSAIKMEPPIPSSTEPRKVIEK